MSANGSARSASVTRRSDLDVPGFGSIGSANTDQNIPYAPEALTGPLSAFMLFWMSGTKMSSKATHGAAQRLSDTSRIDNRIGYAQDTEKPMNVMSSCPCAKEVTIVYNLIRGNYSYQCLS